MAYYLNIQSTVKHGDKDAFRLVSLSGQEEISRPFSFTIELESARGDIKADEIIGKPVAFSVLDSEHNPRHFHGFVSRFTVGSGETLARNYTAEVVPWLWFLTRRSDCRIFADKTIPEVIKAVFADLKIKHTVQNKLSRNYEKWDYCVQYRETDFNFVSRLMEQEGIFYYFEHKEDDHVLVLCDKPDHYYTAKKSSIHYAYSFEGDPHEVSVTSWAHGYQFISGKYTQTDYEFIKNPARGETQPANLLLTTSSVKDKPQTIDPQTYEIFDYPGEYDDKDKDKVYSEIYLDAEQAGYDVVEAASNCECFGPGAKFNLEKHPREIENAEYAVVRIHHAAADWVGVGGEGQNYHNSFACIPSRVTFRPARISTKPAIQGAQTAVVVGPPGSEINTDEHGRVQVQFFWDRYNTRQQPGGDEKKKAAPVWIRVAQIIAGKNWGAMFIPRVGQEVVVTFLEGDPDRPLITGVVYNGDQTPPYKPKDEATKSYIKTNTSPGGEGFNEIRFEDKKDREQVFFHAQRNMDTRVRNSSMEAVGGVRHLIVGGEKDGKKSGDQREMVYQDKHLTVHRHQIEQIGGNQQLLVGGIEGDGNQDIVIQGNKKELINKNDHLHVKGDRKEKIDGGQSLTVAGDQQEKIGMKHAVEAGQEIHLKAGLTAIIEAGVQLTLKVGGSFVDISPVGVTIQGPLVMINSGGAAGSGSGSSPVSPDDAESAKPTAPDQADDAKSGQKSTTY